MAVYQYEAMNRQGSVITGEVTAVDEPGAVSRLQETGLTVLELREQRDKQAIRRKRSRKKVKVADLALFSRQLAAMLGAGIPVTQSISTLARQTENPTLQEALEDISASVEGGLNLVQSFARHPKVFPPLYLGMIDAGETGGILETALLRLSNQLQKEKQLNDNVRSATSYPKMIGGFAVIMFLAMLVGLVPIFEGFIPATATIPAVTQFTFRLSHSIRTFWYVWLGGVALVVFFIMHLTKSRAGHDFWERHKMTIPLFGPIIQKSVIARFCRTLATLLQGGIPVVQALKSAGPTAGSDLVDQAVNTAIQRIEEGRNISQPLGASGLFPPMVINMIAIGEEAGTLPELLDKVAEFYEDDVATLTKSLGSMIEPIMLVLIGVVVGGMLISLYLPIFTAVTA
ncbi:MAG: type II secretion system F family protein [Oscillospiraceae bacterium]